MGIRVPGESRKVALSWIALRLPREGNILQSTALLIVGQIVAQGLAFIRNIVVVRSISPEDFGIATSLLLCLAVVELVSNFAVERLIVQHENGDATEFQGTAHSFQMLRGFVLAALVLLVAGPLSEFFSIPQAKWAFQISALIPLMRGFMHLDAKRMQRSLRFGGDTLIEVVPQAVALGAVLPVLLVVKDYSVVLLIVCIQTCAAIILSHIVAERRYSLSWTQTTVAAMMFFGIPLLVNGVIIMIGVQGDRILIGNAYGMEQLAVYSVPFSLAITAYEMPSRVYFGLLLPVLAKLQREKTAFVDTYIKAMAGLWTCSFIIAIGFVFLGKDLVVFAYGKEYNQVQSFVGWLGLMSMVRLARTGPTIASMALGDTVSTTLGNLGRSVCMAMTLAAVKLDCNITWIAVIAFVGEVIAFAVITLCLRIKHTIFVAASLGPASLFVVAAFICQLFHGVVVNTGFPYKIVLFLVLSVASVCVAVFAKDHKSRRLVR